MFRGKTNEDLLSERVFLTEDGQLSKSLDSNQREIVEENLNKSFGSDVTFASALDRTIIHVSEKKFDYALPQEELELVKSFLDTVGVDDSTFEPRKSHYLAVFASLASHLNVVNGGIKKES